MFVAGNVSIHAEQIMSELGISEYVHLRDYAYSGETPFMVSTSGYCHGDSRILDEKIGLENVVKIVFDRHTDNSRDQQVNFETASRMLGVSQDELDECSLMSVSQYGSHVLRSYESGMFSQILVVGTDDSELTDCIHPNLFYASHVSLLNGIERKNIYVSVDADVLTGFKPVSQRVWSSDEGLRLDSLTHTLQVLVSHNTLVGFDIVGYDVTREAICSTSSGIEVYRRVLDAVNAR